MRLALHPKVYSDIDKIMEYYEQVAAPQLADEFYAELRLFIQEAMARPESFPIRERGLRRVNLRRFPYHFLFRIAGDAVRIRRPASQTTSIFGDQTPMKSPDHAPRRTRPSRTGCNPRAPWTGSSSLGR